MSQIEEAIDSYVQESVEKHLNSISWPEIVQENLDFADMVQNEVDFGDLARDALIDNVSDVLLENIPYSIKEIDLDELIIKQVDFNNLISENVDLIGMAKDAVENILVPKQDELLGEIQMLKLEIAKLKDGAKPQSWLRKVAAVFGL